MIGRFLNGVGINPDRLAVRIHDFMVAQSIARTRAAWVTWVDANIIPANLALVCGALRVLLKELPQFADTAETDPVT